MLQCQNQRQSQCQPGVLGCLQLQCQVEPETVTVSTRSTRLFTVIVLTRSTRLFTVTVSTRSTRLFTVTVLTRSTRLGVNAGGRITDRYNVLWKYTWEVGLLLQCSPEVHAGGRITHRYSV